MELSPDIHVPHEGGTNEAKVVVNGIQLYRTVRRHQAEGPIQDMAIAPRGQNRPKEYRVGGHDSARRGVGKTDIHPTKCR